MLPAVKVSFSLKGQRAVLRKLDRLSKRSKAILREEVERSAERTKRGAQGRAPRDAGELRESIEVNYRSDHLGARIGTSAPHAWPVHSGLARRWYSPRALEPWVGRNLEVEQARDDEAAAFLVARAISEQGTKGRPFLFPAFQEERRPFTRTVRRRIRELPRRLAGGGG